MQICAPIAWKSYNAEVADRSRRSRKRSNPTSETDSGIQQPLAKYLKEDKVDRSELITKAISKYLIKSMRPVSEVENEGFVDMWKEVEPDYHLPTRKTMRNKLKQHCEAVDSKLKDMINGSVACAAQCDIWTSRRMHGYFGLCLTLLNESRLETRLVACRRFLGAHTAENISSMYSVLVQELGISNKLQGTVTDNASNMVKAFKPNEEQTNEQQLHLAASPDDNDDDDLMRVTIDWNEVQDEFPTTIPPRYGCLAHSLQLVIKDGMNEATARIKSLIQKCASLVATIHKSCKATELLEEYNVSHIPMPNATRWNSTYAMLSGLIKAEDTVDGILKKVSDVAPSTVVLSPKDLDTIKELRGLLSHFAHATKLLESETQPTSGLVIPTIVGLKKAMQLAKTQHATSVKTGLQCSLASRFSWIMTDEHFLISAALSPSCKLKWTETQDQEQNICSIIRAQLDAMPSSMGDVTAEYMSTDAAAPPTTSTDTEASQCM